jgi:hypothetical protein
MTSTKVTRYWLGFNIVDKQGYLYYVLEGDPNAHQIFLDAHELTAVAELFREGGQVMFNENAGQHYFVTEPRAVPAEPKKGPKKPGQPT